jgi:hypothetical protein
MNASVNGILSPYRKENDIMKAKLHKLMATAVLGLALFSNSLPAWAGVATINEVYVSPGGSYAQGSRTGARYSADSEQFIGCFSFFDRGSSSPYGAVYCFASDKTGNYTYCASSDARIADAVKGMTDSSHIYFTVSSPTTRICTDLTIDNASIYLR